MQLQYIHEDRFMIVPHEKKCLHAVTHMGQIFAKSKNFAMCILAKVVNLNFQQGISPVVLISFGIYHFFNTA